MYAVGESLPLDRLDPGSFLISGPAMSGKYDLLIELLAQGLSGGQGVILVSTNETARYVTGDVEAAAPDALDRLRIVDCVSQEPAVGEGIEADQVSFVSSPADLTGIGIGVSEHLRWFDEAGVDEIRLGFYSLSTLLMYADLETVFRFVHVVVGRVEGIDGIGFFAIDPTTHEGDVLNTLKQLFDGIIETREDGGSRELRLLGTPDTTDEWIAIT